MRRTSLALLCACAVLFLIGLAWPGTLWAQGRGKGHAKHANDHGSEGHAVVRIDERDAWRDGDRCRVVVTEYYDRRGLPPGLAKKGSLPPGLQKQLRERGHLPPGLEKHWVVLPVELERSLPPLPPHCIRRAVGEDLLVIDVRVNTVVSIMAGVFIRR